MDALEFLREYKRMCKSFGGICDGCPLHKGPCTVISSENDGDLKRILVEVEQWSKEHPRKTRQSVFLEQWPDAKIDTRGCLDVCPYLVSASHRTTRGRCAQPNVKCYDCRRAFWMQEVE